MVSHDHYDHIASAAAICKQSNALLGGPDETMKRLMQEEGLEPHQIVNQGAGYITGGGTTLPWCKVIATPAIHTSNSSIPMGSIVKMEDGTTIYHAGDTCLTAEMELFARLYPLDLAILPIYGIATMDALQAAEAVRLMKPKMAMPIHFDFCKNPQEELNSFVTICRKKNPEVEILIPEPAKAFPV